MKYPEFDRLSGYANELRDAMRRRKHGRRPRARVRLGEAEPRVLAEDSDHGRLLLDLARRFAKSDQGPGDTTGV